MHAPDRHLLTPPALAAVPVVPAVVAAGPPVPPMAAAVPQSATPSVTGRPDAARDFGTRADGSAFPPEIVDAVWRNAREIPGFDPDLWRLDANGDSICRPDYRCAAFRFGWEIDHIRPVVLGGDDDPGNLQPLRIDTNRHRKGDRCPWPEP